MPSMVDMLLPAIYIKLSDERRRLTRITYNEIFNLVFIKDKLERDRYYSNLFSKSDLYKILGLIDKKQQKYTNNEVELRLIDFIKISTLDSYINYHVIRSNQFKKNVYFSLGKFNEFYLRGYSYSKSDEVYSYILQSLSMKSNNDLSDMDFKEIINSVKSVFYENKHIERDYEIKNKMLNLIKKERENKYEELSIYWGTNRKPGQYENGLYFDNRRNDSSQQDHEISVGHSLVTIPSKHKSGLIEKKKKWWGFWRNKKEDINNYIVIHSHESMEKNDWQNAIRKEKDDSEGLLFIHGYNCSFDDGIYRSAQLKYDLKFSGPTFCFSWASAANVASYMKDETTVDWSSVHLKEFLYLIKSGLKLSKLHIIAHSMGSRLLVSIIDELKQEIDFIHTIVFAAPDIDAAKMRQVSKCFSGFNNVTLYSSIHDKAIGVSSVIHQYPRAGNLNPPLVINYVDTIDVSEIGCSMFSLGHNYFTDVVSVFDDLFCLIKNNIPANDREGIVYNEFWKCFVLV